jgi:hypothetical protein
MATQEGRIKISGTEWLAHLGVARPYAAFAGSLTLTPSLRLLAQGSNLDGASEKDLGGMEVNHRGRERLVGSPPGWSGSAPHVESGVEAFGGFAAAGLDPRLLQQG